MEFRDPGRYQIEVVEKLSVLMKAKIVV